MAQDRLARLITRPRLDLTLEDLPDATEPHMAERVELAGLQLHRAFLRLRALGDDDDRRVVPGEALLDVAAHGIDVERPLRDEDHVGATGETRVQRDPARMTTHD